MDNLFKLKGTRLIAATPFLLYLVNPCKKDLSLKLALIALIWALVLLSVDLLFRDNEKYNTLGYIIITIIYIAAYFVFF